MMNPFTRVAAAFFVVSVLCSVPASAQFDRSKPSDIALVFMPFGLDFEEDRSVAFLLEDYLGSHLARRIGHPVLLSSDVQPAIPMGKGACLQDRSCVELLGGQFNASMVVDVHLRRTGEEISLETDWYLTGNGLRVGQEVSVFAVGDERQMIEDLTEWFKDFYDSSLRVSSSNRASAGLAGGSSSAEQQERLDDYQRGRTKRKASRREDFSVNNHDEARFDRDDPTSDLRALVEEDEQPDYYGRVDSREEERSERRPARRKEAKRQYVDDDFADYPAEEPDEPRARPARKAAQTESPVRPPRRREAPSYYDDEDINLDADETSGRSVASFSEAQRMGIGPREYKRFARTGLTIARFKERRWAYGKRFHVRAGGFYGLGYLTRRYASTLFIDVGARKTDEYMWESLGFSAVNPGGSLGIGYSPVDLLDVEFELSFMGSTQSLLREYQSRDIGNNIRQEVPADKPTLHVLTDLRARFFLKPTWRVKITPGLGVTLVFMSGYNIAPEPPLEYTGRPLATVVGLTPLVGMTAALSPYVSLYIDVLPTIYLSSGAARYEAHVLFNGATEENLTEQDKSPPLFDCPSSCPIMTRISVGTMILF